MIPIIPKEICLAVASKYVLPVLFRTFICNAYDCHLWSKYKQYSYKRIVVAFYNIYPILFGIQRGESMSAIYDNNNIDTFILEFWFAKVKVSAITPITQFLKYS